MTDYIRDYEVLRLPRQVKDWKELRSQFPRDPKKREEYMNDPSNYFIRTRWEKVENPSTAEFDHKLVMGFGKHKGKTYEEIAMEDPQYGRWLCTKVEFLDEWRRCYMGWLLWGYHGNDF